MCFKRFFSILFLFSVILSAGLAVENQAAAVGKGLELYAQGRWMDAIGELRQVWTNDKNPAVKAEALYWIAMSCLAANEFEAAIGNFNQLQKFAPGDSRFTNIPYQKGRAYFYMGKFNEALVEFKEYINAVALDTHGENALKPSAYYWVGECLYALGQIEKAEQVFLLIVEQYPQSAKFEASSYRLALINQKKIEIELLGLLKKSHDEYAAKTADYEKQKANYESAIKEYQSQISALQAALKDMSSPAK
jgi:TolA-binding protein